MKVLQVTDPHLFADREAALRGTVTYSTLQDVLEHIDASGWPAELLLLTGDLVQDDSEGAYAHVATLIGSLGLPVLAIPGNHDVRDLMAAALKPPIFDYCGTIRRGDWLIVGIDSCIRGSAAGHVSDAELVRLRDSIAASDAAHVLVCLHHPPLPVGSQWLDSVGLRNGHAFLDVAAESGRVRAVLFGHVHQAFDAMHASIQVIGTPSTCRQFKVGSDEFALDDLPPAYRQIELHPDGTVTTELKWLDT